MKKLLILFIGVITIGLLGCKLAKELTNNNKQNHLIGSSENQHSDPPSSLSQEELKELWFKNLRLTDLWGWNSQLRQWIKVDIKENGFFEITCNTTFIEGKAKIFKSYSFYEAVSASKAFYIYDIFYVMDSTPSLSDSSKKLY